ncbi:ribonuclease III [Rappaport israeli]|uniref:ribonuclease III n=1 Tax=Rappaport israeli TaxID=1839807 RepID=UPI000931FB69|nr:ribonuclease III [Rappaport israeli]
MIQHQKDLEAQIGYRFKQPEFLTQALTHRSYNSIHNERLEYLGDALLETIISVWLYRYYPNASEGDLTRQRASIVKGAQLAKIASHLNLGQFIRLGSGELKTGGATRSSTLANTLEAIIAAIYLDSNYDECERTTLALFERTLTNLPDAASLKDPKTQLQELLQGQGMATPKYVITKESGPEHRRQFHITATTEHYQVQAVDYSRKKAEQQAAQILLNLYNPKSKS